MDTPMKMGETSRAIDKKLSVNNIRATMRSYEISCTVIIQNMAQLKTMYKDSYESITGNCDSFLFLGGQEQTTLEYVSKKLGKETIRTQNTSRNVGGKGGGGSITSNTSGRDLMTADEISRMDTSDCILFIRGLLPFYGKKYKYTEHPNYQYTGDADKSLIFSVADEFHTMRNVLRKTSPYADEKRRIKIMTERAENRESEKLDRMERERRRNVRTHSAKGEPLYKDQAFEEAFVKTVAEKAKKEGTSVAVVEENLPVPDGYTPTLEKAFDEFYVPSEEELETMEPESYSDAFEIDEDNFRIKP